MAWYKRYGIPFQSLGGTQYMVYILEHTFGTLVTLTGAAEPFTTCEDDSDNIFTPIRFQTGTLRIIDETGNSSLMETLMPHNNTEKLVQLWSGTWNSGMTTFTDGILQWQGFLCAEAYTQPWDNNTKMLEFPVKSLLAALDDIVIPSSNASMEGNIAKLIKSAFDELNVTPDLLDFITDLSDVSTQLLEIILTWSIFFQEDVENNDIYTYKQLIGVSYAEALSYVASLYGLMIREQGNTLTFAQYDNTFSTRLIKARYSWASITAIASGGSPSPSVSTMSDLHLLNAVTFKGNNNIMGFLQGRKSAKVVLNIGGIALHLELPETAEDSSTVIDVEGITGGRTGAKVYVQPHAPRSIDVESYHFYKYIASAVTSGGIIQYYSYVYSTTATYQQCLDNTVLYLYQYTRPDLYPLYVGAFPCRWFYLPSNNPQSIILQNGLFLNQQPLQKNKDQTTGFREIYSIISELDFDISDGYINIDFLQHSFSHYFNAAQYWWVFDHVTDSQGLKLSMYCALKIGSKYWNGQEWTDTQSTFTIPFTNTNIDTNKTAAMNVDSNKGWFIPVEDELKGKVQFCIYDTVIIEPTQYNGNTVRVEAHSRIVSDLDVVFLKNNALSASGRNNNTYQETILLNGFSNDEEIALSIGTINNNRIAPCFIKDESGYLQMLSYNLPSSGSENMRPELRLAARMAGHYEQVRRTLIAQVQSGISLPPNRYSYENRKFFGIDKQHNWRDDIQDVKFIEVS